ncbi:MAG: hypothetical protein IPO20_19430 [Gammaproteobacteria bacterium]|nr:hypothetical protein [Gammaproteobacteria bacterium]
MLVLPLPLQVSSALLSPGAFEIYTLTLGYTGQEQFSLSLDVDKTLEEFLKSAAYLSIFFLTLVLADTRRRLRQLAYALMLIGLAQSLFGLLDLLLDGTLFKRHFLLVYNPVAATGTYVNPNHFGGLLEMAIPMVVGVILLHGPRHDDESPDWRARAQWRSLVFCSRANCRSTSRWS